MRLTTLADVCAALDGVPPVPLQAALAETVDWRGRRREAFTAAVTALLPGLRGWQAHAVAELSPAVLWQAARASWTTSAPPASADLIPPAPPAGFRTTLGELLQEIPAAGVLRVPTFVPPPTPSAPHLEGAAKSEAVMTFGAKDVPLRSVATVVHVTDELLEDAPQLTGWLDAYLEYLVRLGEERQLLLGDGVAPNVLGYRAWPGIVAYVPSATTIGGKLAGAAAAVATASGLEADTYVISAIDWATLVEEGSGTLDADAGRLHGRTVIHTPVLATGQMLVGACQAASVLGRTGGITVEGTQSHDLNFTKNLSTIRAASRIALGVIQPSAFVKVG